MGCCQLTKASRASKRTLSTHRSSYSNLITITHSSITNDYTFLNQLGEGSFGQVRKAAKNDTGAYRAIKTINIHNLEPQALSKILQEVKILKSLDHPGVIKIFEVYQEPRYLHIVTELCTGGDLFQRIQARGHLSENFAGKLLLDIVSAVKYCHEVGVCHRDLKPENIMFEDKSLEARVKIIDFGTSAEMQVFGRMKTFLGTAYYMAPEITEGEYTEKCDVWSIGIILYIMLSGGPPFRGNSFTEIMNNIKTEKVAFKGAAWRKVSDECKNLITKMLEKDPDERFSIEEVFVDQWLVTRSKGLLPDRELTSKAFQRLEKFKTVNKLQTCILSFLTHQAMTCEKINELRKLFEQIDKNNDGQLSREEIQQAMDKNELGFTVDIDELFKQCDFDQNGVIEFSEFITAVHSCEIEFSSENLKKAFAALDKDKNGKISKEEVKEVLSDLDEENISQIFQQFDKDGSGEINFREFISALMPVSGTRMKNRA